MFNLVKYLPLVALGKDVSASYQESTGQDRPKYLSRRFVGSAIALIGGFLAIHFGVQIDKESLMSVADSVEKIVAASMTLWGVVVGIIGIFKRNKTAIVIAMLFLPMRVSAASFSEFYYDMREQTKLTILKSATPAYFYELTKEESNRNQGGVTTSIIEYRFLSADTGWIHSIESTEGIGSAVIGGGVHLDRLVNQVVPGLTDVLVYMFPNSMEKFWDRLTVGAYTSHNFDKKRFAYGLYSGLELKF